MIALMLVFFVSGCSKVNDYNLDSNKVFSTDDITLIFNQMIEENGHSLNLSVPHDKIVLAMSKQSKVFEISLIMYMVQTTSWIGNEDFETFSCRSENSILTCQQSKFKPEIDELVEEITLSDTIDLLSEVDIDLLIDYLRDEYEIFFDERTMIQFGFESFDNEMITEDTSDYFVEIHYNEGAYQEEKSFGLNGIKLVVSVTFEIDDDNEAFKVYYD
jgi:hypothetical protein